jgi:hypothetical protein
MANIDEQILRAAKEIVVKFIETGRLSPTAFEPTFKTIYRAVQQTVKGPSAQTNPDDETSESS